MDKKRKIKDLYFFLFHWKNIFPTWNTECFVSSIVFYSESVWIMNSDKTQMHTHKYTSIQSSFIQTIIPSNRKKNRICFIWNETFFFFFFFFHQYKNTLVDCVVFGVMQYMFIFSLWKTFLFFNIRLTDELCFSFSIMKRFDRIDIVFWWVR